ncbi:hypothetical protein EB796_011657 [Bugula neritina]|uniref:Uncharacterized protein n=1 Tax=Bugula neritina TaxID=10212 RepID=A0A7J7JW05_BUGNE|nr:hypothetical protein EB796_011657 [Bugula neritina]
MLVDCNPRVPEHGLIDNSNSKNYGIYNSLDSYYPGYIYSQQHFNEAIKPQAKEYSPQVKEYSPQVKQYSPQQTYSQSGDSIKPTLPKEYAHSTAGSSPTSQYPPSPPESLQSPASSAMSTCHTMSYAVDAGQYYSNCIRNYQQELAGGFFKRKFQHSQPYSPAAAQHPVSNADVTNPLHAPSSTAYFPPSPLETKPSPNSLYWQTTPNYVKPTDCMYHYQSQGE